MDALKPTPGLLCKIVSVLVHADEMRESKNDPHAHGVDEIALTSALDDPEVKEWVEAMTKMSMAPIKRSRAMSNPQPFNREPAADFVARRMPAVGSPKKVGGRKVPKAVKHKHWSDDPKNQGIA